MLLKVAPERCSQQHILEVRNPFKINGFHLYTMSSKSLQCLCIQLSSDDKLQLLNGLSLNLLTS